MDAESTQVQRFLKWLLGVLALALLYYGAGRLSLLLAIPPGYATALWPASGIALAGLLLFDQRLWPGVLLGSFCVNIPIALDTSSGEPLALLLALTLGIASGAVVQAVVGATLIARHVRIADGLLHSAEVVKLLALGGPLSCLINASVGTTLLWGMGQIPAAEYLFSWTTWWVGDSIGVLLVLPLAFVLVGQPRQLWQPRALPLSASLLLTLTGVVIIFSVASTEERARIALEYERQARTVGASLERRMDAYTQTLRSLQSFFAASTKVTRSEFRRYVEPVLARMPGLQALSWNPYIPASKRIAFERAARQAGIADFTISERDATGALVPAAARPYYVFVYYIEPYFANEEALGFDVSSDATRRAAMERARDLGQVVATAPIKLVQEANDQVGILLFLPVYAVSAMPPSLADRRASLLGYVVGVFRLGDLLAAAVAESRARAVEVRLYYQSLGNMETLVAAYRIDGGGRGTLLDSSRDDPPMLPLAWSNRYTMGTRTWRLVVTPNSSYLSRQRSWVAWSVLAIGLAFTSLLGAFLLILTGRAVLDKQRAQDLVQVNGALQAEVEQRQRTERALYAEKERAEVTLHSIGDAVITTDAEGNVDYLNPMAEMLTEWKTKEAHGKPLMTVARIIHDDTDKSPIDLVAHCRAEKCILNPEGQLVLISRSGREYAIKNSAAPIWDHDGHMLGVVLVFSDVSKTRRMVQEAAYYASHDVLTGLVNRREFDRRLELALASSKRHGTQHALCYLDLDQFKIVNDTVGHRAGDELLKQITTLFTREVRERDTLARLGGDEFALLLNNCPLEKALEIANVLIATVHGFVFVWNERSFELGVSIGLVPVDGRLRNAEEALARADVACYAAKDAGRNRVYVYRNDGADADPRHREIQRVADVRSAIEHDHFRLFAQPIVALKTHEPACQRYEILLRMLAADATFVAPSEFISAAERYGMMNALDRWVISTVFRDSMRLFPQNPAVLMTINLSGNSLNDDGLLPFLRQQFAEHDLAPRRVCFEIAEMAALRNLSLATAFIHQVRELGCQFALDDFGAGLYSFSYLKDMPIDFLKLDGSLIANLTTNAKDRVIVAGMINLVDKLDMEIIAEGVETAETLAVLRELGAHYAQGYALGRPAALPLA